MVNSIRYPFFEYGNMKSQRQRPTMAMSSDGDVGDVGRCQEHILCRYGILSLLSILA